MIPRQMIALDEHAAGDLVLDYDPRENRQPNILPRDQAHHRHVFLYSTSATIWGRKRIWSTSVSNPLRTVLSYGRLFWEVGGSQDIGVAAGAGIGLPSDIMDGFEQPVES